MTLTFPVILRPDLGTIAFLTNQWVAQLPPGILIISRTTLLAIGAHRMAKTSITHSSRPVPGSQIFERIVVASVRVTVTLASLAGVGDTSNRRHPRQIVVEILALLAVQAFSVVLTLAFAVDHVSPMDPLVLQRNAPRSVSVARAGSSHHHVVDGVVVLLLNSFARI